MAGGHMGETGEIDERLLAATVAVPRSLPLPAASETHGNTILPRAEGRKVPAPVAVRAALEKWQERILSMVETEQARGAGFLLVPVFVGAGALAYHGIPHEPDITVVAGLVVLSLALVYLARGRALFGPSLKVLALLLIGLAVAALETWRLSTPMLGSAVTTTVTGRIVEVEKQATGRMRLLIDVVRTAGPQLNYPPERIRVTASSLFDGAAPGRGIEGKVRLMPVSGPVRPGGYDFAWRAFFDGHGASGFFLGRPKLADLPAPNVMEELAASLEALRHGMAGRIRARIGGAEGEIAAALIVGTAAGVPRQLADAMRLSGLFHVLSISGLHMALVAGLFLGALRFALALIPGVAERWPVKKVAAAAALAGATFYLFLSGAAVATQRSYLMIAVMLVAVMIDRAALTMRNLAIAALAIIIWTPHEVAGPSFQLSFAATAALVAGWAAFSRWRAKRLRRRVQRGWGMTVVFRVLAIAGGIAGTSLLAGGATTLFSAWHFQRIAPLGLVANLGAMPVVSLVIMPSATLAALLMPFGLDGPALDLMGWGISVMDAVAAWTAAHSPLDGVGLVPAVAVIAGATGLVLASVATTRLAWAAVPFFAAALLLAPSASSPKIWVAENGSLVGVVAGDRLFVDRARPNAFTVETWRRAANAAQVVSPGKAEGAFECGADQCRFQGDDGLVVVHVKDAAAAAAHCADATLIVVDDPAAADVCLGGPATVIGRRALARQGSAAVNVVYHGGRPSVSVVYALTEPFRPWNAHRAYSREARGLRSRIAMSASGAAE